MTDELPKEEAERRALEVAQRMLTTPKKPKTDAEIRSAPMGLDKTHNRGKRADKKANHE
jgi:hypothetical protein